MTLLQAIILGLIQGLTEFLPVSSSGHLVLAQHLFGVENFDVISFDVYVHLGTLVSIFFVFWKDVRDVVQAIWIALTRFQIRKSFRESEPFRLGIAIIIGSIPAGVIGLIYRDQIKDAFTDPKLVAMNLVITGLILFLTRLSKPVEGKKVGIIVALIVGVAQAMAILPGISRSGSTISAAMYFRISPVQAARFSFLLAIPAIAGAGLVETSRFVNHDVGVGTVPILAGTIVAAAAGYFAIKILLSITERGKFSLFSFYCLTIGILGIVFV